MRWQVFPERQQWKAFGVESNGVALHLEVEPPSEVSGLWAEKASTQAEAVLVPGSAQTLCSGCWAFHRQRREAGSPPH